MESETPFLPRWMIAALAATMLVLVAGGTWFYLAERETTLNRATENLASIASLKIDEVTTWRRDRVLDGRELSESPFLAAGVARYLATPDGQAQQDLLERFRSIQRQQDYFDVLLVTPDGQVHLRLGRVDRAPEGESEPLADALRSRVTLMTDLHLDEEHPFPHLRVIAPIIAPGSAPPRSIAAIVVIIDAAKFLYPLIQTWPTASPTAETLLVRRDGDSVLFLNDLRHRRGAALQFRIPLARGDVPAVMAVLGGRGLVHGRDYRGTPVVAFLQRVPNSSWHMVTKVDEAEVFAEWRTRATLILSMLAALIATVFALGLVAWQRGTKRHYLALYQSEARLRASIERHGITLRSIGDAVIAADEAGRVELLNPVAEALTGWTDDEAHGKPLKEVLHLINDETRAELEDPVDRILREGAIVGLASRTLLIARDGTERSIADSGAPIRNCRGEPTGVVLVFRDQTNERKQEQTLLNSEERYRTLFESSGDAVLVADETGVLDCNDAAVRMFGAATKADLRGRLPSSLSPAVQPSGHPSAVLANNYRVQAMNQGSVSFEWTYRRLGSDEPFPAEVCLSPMVIDGRRVIQITAHDITERKRLEQAIEQRILALTRPLDQDAAVNLDQLFDLRELQRIQDEFAAATGVASIITTPDGTPITRPSNFTRLCNDIIRGTEMGRMNCYRSDAVIGCLHPDGPIIQPCLSGGLWDAGASITVGDHHVANWLIGQVRDSTQTEDAIRRYALEIGADEQAVLDAFREVPAMSRERFGHVAQALHTLANRLSSSAYQNIQQARFIADRAFAEAERETMHEQFLQAQKMESVGRLAGGVAHDFNNMLAAIMGYTELVLSKINPSDSIYDDLLEVQKAAQRSADLTRQLLAFARRQTISPRVVDLNDIVDGHINMLSRLIGEQISLAWHPRADLWPVCVDPVQISQLLTNLCVNARDAIADVGMITIETGNAIFDATYCLEHPGFSAGDFAQLSVSDNGSGMDKTVVAHLFEPFFTTKGPGTGTGLGLATVYGVVKQNNGFINVYSEPGHGSVFKVYLPRHVGTVEAALAPQVEAAPAVGHETVLLVEDEPAMLAMARTALSRLGYDVLSAAAPAAAIQLATSFTGPIHVLLTDVVMPGMNGRDLATRLQALRPGLVCVYMSGYTADMMGARGALDEGVAFIEKPFTFADLGRTIRKALTQR
jgi:PAS domain S-box-containing protein